MDRKLLKDDTFHDDRSVIWQGEPVLTDVHQEVLVPMALWQTDKKKLSHIRTLKLLYILPDDELAEMESELNEFDGIAIEFPSFLDGRGYSHARYLRDHCRYQGEIRAVGDVLVDQLFFMQRCGFSSFALEAGQNPDAALKALSSFTHSYQTASDSRKALHFQRDSQSSI